MTVHWVFLLLGMMLAAMWINAFATKRRLIRNNQRLGPYIRQVYSCWAFTIAAFIMVSAYLTPSQF